MPVLVDETKGGIGNPWGISFMAMLHMANDSGLFRTARDLFEAGAEQDGADWIMPGSVRLVPLYEAKMIHHYDHRWATYEAHDDLSRDVTNAEKCDPSFAVTPRYWTPQNDVTERLAERGWQRRWLMGWRNITGVENVRTVVAELARV